MNFCIFRLVLIKADVGLIYIPQTQGLIPIKLGTARTIRDYRHLVHIINLEAYADNVQEIENTLQHFKSTQFAKIAMDTTYLKLKELKTKLDILTPEHRGKRGLFNALGSTIKFITGNLDYTDAEKLNREIENLMTNNVNMNNTLTGQIILNTDMIKRFENITNHINKEQDILTRSITNLQEQTQNSINPTINTILQIQQLNQINYNIDTLTQHLNNIAEAIVLAKLNIVSKLILSPLELTEIHHTLNNTINVISTEHIYELLELYAYYNNTNIIFNIQIPVIANETFTFFHLIKTPINKTLEIISKDYVLHNKNELLFVEQKCKEIETIFFCKDLLKEKYEMNYNCIKDIFNNETSASCHLKDVGEKVDIIRSDENYLILINSPAEQLTTICGNNTRKHIVNGTILIHYENCKICINNLWYSSIRSTHWDSSYFAATPIQHDIKILPLSKKNQLTLPKLNTFQFHNRGLIENLEVAKNVHERITYSTFGSIAFILTAIIIAMILCKPKMKTYLVKETNEIPTEVRPNSLWPSLHSKGGGVTVCH